MTNYFHILANPRSGTSFLRHILNINSKISIPVECNYLLWLHREGINEIKDLGFLRQTLGNFPKFKDLQIPVNRIIDNLKTQSVIKPIDIHKTIQQLYANDILGKSFDNIILGDKNRTWKDSSDMVLDVFKETKIIHLVRDPRDVFTSYKKLHENEKIKGLTKNVEEFISEWNQINEKILLLKNKFSYHLVTYSDLVYKLEQTIESLCVFLEIEPEERMFKYWEVKAFGISEPIMHKSWKMKIEQKVDTTGIGQYKSYLSKHELQVITQKMQNVKL